MKNNTALGVWFLSLMLLDQLIKYWVSSSFMLGESLTILPIFNLTYVHNTGVAFSFFANDDQVGRWGLVILSSIVSLGIFVWLMRLPKQKILMRFALVTILAGAVGNILDRMYFGYVRDYFDFHLGTWHFAVFNFADTMITLGAVCMIIDMLLHSQERGA